MVKVIPVAGLSGSGKTTFIRGLIPLLAGQGPVGTVKHAGRHGLDLPRGKDTTVMFGSGAVAAAGIDREKTLITLRSTSLAAALEILSGQGVMTAVVEGWKGIPWPKVVIGDLEVEGCILRNPDPAEVIRLWDRFPDYFTMAEILRGLKEDCTRRKGPCILASSTVPLPNRDEGVSRSSVERSLPGVVGMVEGLPGVIGARAVLRPGSLFGEADEILIAVGAGSVDTAAASLEYALSRCREILEAKRSSC